MINVFFDCEFTKLQLPNDPEPNEMISIGCISEDGKRFYAENATTLARPEIFSDFVVEVVVPLLEGGEVASDGLGCLRLARHPAQCASDQIDFHTIREDGADT